jgi:DNA-binding response OmpR family regulator
MSAAPPATPLAAAPARSHTVVVYSDDPKVRDTVRTAVGRRPAADLGRVEWVEVAAGPELVRLADKGGLDLLILDGEAWPTGGLGLARQLKEELADCPPTLVLIARKDDRWLAKWSQADAVLAYPIDPAELAAAATDLLRQREARLPVRRVAR